MAVLMLGDTVVYDIANHTVIEKTLCPFADASNPQKAYKQWRSNRTYLKTNRLAERVVQQAGGVGTREAKRRLSLSDSYWIRYSYDNLTSFKSITPYLNRFSEAYISSGSARSSSVPELVIGGSQPKQWARSSDGMTYMRKTELPEQIKAEMLAVKLIRKCKGKVMNAFVQTDEGRVYADHYPISMNSLNIGVINLVNMTNVNRSMIQFDQLGIGVDGFDPASVADGYLRAGVMENCTTIALCQVIFDAIVGNIDRQYNRSNWAIFLDHSTGKRTPSWMYDFNWASLHSEDTEQISVVAANIKKIGSDTVRNAVMQAAYIRGVCEELGLAAWRDHSQNVINKLNG